MASKQKKNVIALVAKAPEGLSTATRAGHAKALGQVLAGTYVLMLKSQNYHWNVTGPYFTSLHTLFQTHYEALFLAVDELAERIRALGFKAPGTYGEFLALTALKEDKTAPKNWQAMVKNLLQDHETLANTARALLGPIADAGDDITAGILTDRVAEHEKTAWMLRVHLEA